MGKGVQNLKSDKTELKSLLKIYCMSHFGKVGIVILTSQLSGPCSQVDYYITM